MSLLDDALTICRLYNQETERMGFCEVDPDEMRTIESALREARTIVDAIAECEPYCESGMGDIECALCNGHWAYEGKYQETFQHAPDCPLVLARALKAGAQ